MIHYPRHDFSEVRAELEAIAAADPGDDAGGDPADALVAAGTDLPLLLLFLCG